MMPEKNNLTPILRLPSPAKLNLFLHITGRRHDGYHNLQTVFQLIDACDWLTFKPNTTGVICMDTPLIGVADADNLIMKAAKLLQHQTKETMGCTIGLEKNLPMGGGLGGGSSNAATTLLALNHLWQTGLSLQALADLGLQLGADVPVFVLGHSAWAEGVGEQLQPINLPEQCFVVLKPDCFISTQDLFAAVDLPRNTPPVKLADYLADLKSGQLAHYHNDCEVVATTKFTPVAQALAYLKQFGAAKMTGTGACVFLPLPLEMREKAQQILAAAPCAGFVCQALDKSQILLV